MEKYTCPCCGYKTFDEAPGSYDICPICFWEDDKSQLLFPTHGGANPPLIVAQGNFEKFGACKQDVVQHVRKPNNSDEKDPKWRRFDMQKDAIRESAPEKNYLDRVMEADVDPLEYYWLREK